MENKIQHDIQQLIDFKNNRFMNNIMLKILFVLFLLISISIATSATEPSFTVADCRNCHGSSTVTLHHNLYPTIVCDTCHQMSNDIRNCLICHPTQNHVNCIACHSPEDVNSPRDVNISLFGRHANINISDGSGNVTNNDCWTCHYNKNMNTSNVYLCESCHINNSGIVPIADPSLVKSDFMHGMTSCKDCHAPIKYHNNGTTGPLGVIDNILKKFI